MCVWAADFPHETAIEKRYWLHWAMVYFVLSLALGIVALVLLILNLRWHARHRNSQLG